MLFSPMCGSNLQQMGASVKRHWTIFTNILAMEKRFRVLDSHKQ